MVVALLDQLLEAIGVVDPCHAAHGPMFHRLTMTLIIDIHI